MERPVYVIWYNTLSSSFNIVVSYQEDMSLPQLQIEITHGLLVFDNWILICLGLNRVPRT